MERFDPVAAKSVGASGVATTRWIEIDGLRGLLALWVLLGHWSSSLPAGPWPIGSRLHNGAAVELFLIVSGLAIAALHAARPQPWRHYIALRALRIFPLYIALLGISALTLDFTLTAWQAAPESAMRPIREAIARDGIARLPFHLATHLPALQGLVPRPLAPAGEFALLGQAWSLSLEWQFYLVAPILVAPFAAHKVVADTALPALLLVVALAFIALLLPMPSGFLAYGLPAFLIGIASHRLLTNRYARRFAACNRPLVTLVALSATCGLLAVCRGELLAFAVWLPLLALLLAEPVEAPIRRMLRSPPLLWLSRIAFPVYLSHMLALVVALRLLEAGPGLDPFAHGALLLASQLAITLPASALLHRWIERPCIAFGKRLFVEPTGLKRGRGSAPDQTHPAQQAAQIDPKLVDKMAPPFA